MFRLLLVSLLVATPLRTTAHAQSTDNFRLEEVSREYGPTLVPVTKGPKVDFSIERPVSGIDKHRLLPYRAPDEIDPCRILKPLTLRTPFNPCRGQIRLSFKFRYRF